MLLIDGSYREGGGQIIRTALVLSVLTQQPFRAVKIRHNRPKPGMKYQHLSCIQALEKLANARVDGAHLGSQAIEFFPGRAKPGVLSLNIGTAGSITLLLQSLLLPVLFAGGKVKLKLSRGTDTKLLEFLNSDAVVDPHLADNIIPLLALMGGSMKATNITDHILSNIYVCEKFLNVHFMVDAQKNLITVA